VLEAGACVRGVEEGFSLGALSGWTGVPWTRGWEDEQCDDGHVLLQVSR
jgi:hypothetical protein